MRSVCKIETCDKKVQANGLCQTHNYRLKKFGDPLHRTLADKNEIVVVGDVAIMSLYDENSIKIAETTFNKKHIGKVSKIKWCLKDLHQEPRYVIGYHNGKFLRLNRYLLDVTDKSIVVDHIDGDTLNNTDDNLRKISHQKNSFNTKLYNNNSSGHNGVSWSKKINKWRAYIMIDGKQISLGVFDKLEDAVESRKEAEIKYFGEYSRRYGYLCSKIESEEE